METKPVQIGYDVRTSQPIFEDRPVRASSNYINRDTPYSRDFVDYLNTLED